MIILPTPPSPQRTPHATLRVQLDGKSYQLGYAWNERDNAWYFSIADSGGAMIVAGVRIVLGAVLNVMAPRDKAPPYPILVVDPTGKGLEPTLTTLGQEIKLVYLEASDG